jgi:NTE family protein
MSYLLFASKYTRALIEIGYDDASKRIDEIESFLYSSDNGTTKPSIEAGKSRQASRSLKK